MYLPNWIELDGVVNMRDLGGMVTADGDTVRPRRLLRSDNLQDLTPEAVDTLVTRYGVTDIVDLRTHVELAKEGDGPLRAVAGITHHHHTLYREDTDESGIPAAERALPWETDERRDAHGRAGATPTRTARHDQFWSEHYLSYLASRPDSVVAALDAIASSEGAAVVHCAAGKDRTGTVVGLALKVVDVPDELVIADFAASAERVAAIMDRLRAKPGLRRATSRTRRWRSSHRRPTRCACSSARSTSDTAASTAGSAPRAGPPPTPTACGTSSSGPEPPRRPDRSRARRSCRERCEPRRPTTDPSRGPRWELLLRLPLSASLESAAMKASCGTSTRPTIFIRFLPSFCFSRSLRLRLMSPP